jgi:hypothetical protein
MAKTPNFELYLPNRNDATVEVDTSLSENFTKIDEELQKVASSAGSKIPTQDTEPEWAEEDDLWIDTSDNTFQGTVFEPLEQKVKLTEGLGINPEKYGLNSDSPDNYQAVIDTLNHVKSNGGGRIVFPHGKVFKFTKPLGVHEISNVYIDLNGSTLDFTDCATNISETLLGFSGDSIRNITMSADLTKGGTSAGVNTSDLIVGDLVKLYSEEVWDPARTGAKFGELSFIKSIDGDYTLTLERPAKTRYSTDYNAVLSKIEPVRNVTVANGQIIGPVDADQLNGITFEYAIDCLVHNVKMKRIDKRHIVITDSIRCNVDNCTFEESYHATQAYGVSFVDATMDCICSNCHFDKVRHSLSTNNNVGSSHGIVRNILFKGNIIKNSAPNIGDGSGGDAVDSHSGAEDIFILDNLVDGSSASGINFEARSGMIKGNRVMNTRSTGIYVHPRADQPSSVIVSDNFVQLFIGDGGGSDYGINIHLNTANGLDYVVSNNIVESDNQCIKLTAESAYNFENPVINGNKTRVKISNYAIQVEQADNASITGNSCLAPSLGIFVRSNNNGAIGSNSLKINGTGTTSWAIRLDSDTSYMSVTGNSMRYSGSGHTTVHGVSVSLTNTNYNGVFCNVGQGFSSVAANVTGTNVAANNV